MAQPGPHHAIPKAEEFERAPLIGYVDGMNPKPLIDSGYRGRKDRTDLPPS
jgi:hypothetical protein